MIPSGDEASRCCCDTTNYRGFLLSEVVTHRYVAEGRKYRTFTGPWTRRESSLENHQRCWNFKISSHRSPCLPTPGSYSTCRELIETPDMTIGTPLAQDSTKTGECSRPRPEGAGQ